jgi:hypothetical protein
MQTRKQIVLFCFAALVFEHLEPFHQLIFVMGFFELRSSKLFAQAEFEP